jgi:hypothetical protein
MSIPGLSHNLFVGNDAIRAGFVFYNDGLTELPA